MSDEQTNLMIKVVKAIEYWAEHWQESGSYDDFHIVHECYDVLCDILGIKAKNLTELAEL